jgi:hypothetical protein
MDILTIVALCAALLGYTRQEAVERGRSGTGWILLGLAGAIIGACVGLLFGGYALLHGAESGAPTLLGVFLVVVMPIMGPLAVLLGLISLPDGVPYVGGRRWPMYCMSTAELGGYVCQLEVVGDAVKVNDRIIRAAELTDIAADGECLRLGWGEAQSLLLMPLELDRADDGNARVRSKRSQGLQRRLRKLLKKL